MKMLNQLNDLLYYKLNNMIFLLNLHAWRASFSVVWNCAWIYLASEALGFFKPEGFFNWFTVFVPKPSLRSSSSYVQK